MLEDLIGDYRTFYADQVGRLAGIGIDVSSYPVSHLAYRTGTVEEYLSLREQIESVSRANVENQWSGRPISKLLLKRPLVLGGSHAVDLIELIPPVHRPGYRLGLEHIGFIVGDDFDSFARRHAAVLTGQQDQGPVSQPLYVTFDNETTVKFHQLSLHDVVVAEGRTFEGFQHVP